MTVSPEDLDPVNLQLQSENRRERDLAAEQLSDVLEYSQLRREGRIAVANWLLDALERETDQVVIESLLNALCSVYEGNQPPIIAMRRLAEYLPRLPTLLLSEYAIPTLGESTDLEMVHYLKPFQNHPELVVRSEAEKAIRLLTASAED